MKQGRLIGSYTTEENDSPSIQFILLGGTLHEIFYLTHWISHYHHHFSWIFPQCFFLLNLIFMFETDFLISSSCLCFPLNVFVSSSSWLSIFVIFFLVVCLEFCLGNLHWGAITVELVILGGNKIVFVFHTPGGFVLGTP